MQDDILSVLGVGQRVRALTMEKAIDHDLVHHALAHPFRRIIIGVIYGDLKALFAAHYAFAASGMIRRCAQDDMLAVKLCLKPIPQKPRLLAYADLRLVYRLAVVHTQQAHRIAMLAAVPHAQLNIRRFLRVFYAKTQAHLPACGNRACRFTIKSIK